MRPDAAGRSQPIPLRPALPVASDRQLFPIAIALAAGAVNVFAFAPFGLWLLQLLATALVFTLVMRAPSVRQAAVLGWLYSFTWTCAGVYWLYISLHDLGGMPAWLTVLAIALLALGLGLLVGAATGGARWLQARWHAGTGATLLLILPALWMLAEWTRSWIFTGFPWLSTGYAHTDAPLAGFAPLLGVYGIGWLAAVIAASLALLVKRTGSPVLPVSLLVLILGVGQALRAIEWTRPHGKPITVRLLQGNIPQAMKFDPGQLGSTLGLYDAMITQAPADLIATPETAVPVVAQQLPPEYLPRLATFAGQSGSSLLIGLPISDSPTQYSNGLIVLDPRGPVSAPASATPPGATSSAPSAAPSAGTSAALSASTAQHADVYRYDKHHLVPFGEFIPTGFRWFVDFMRMPLGDQTRGALLQPPFPVKDQWILPNICYEDLFGEEIAAQMRARVAQNLPVPTMMINISNIAWFGDSIALPQHLQISQMRTLETGRPMLRSTNTGATAVIGADGRVQAQLAPYTRGTLAASVQGYEGMTPFIRFGNGTIVSLAGVMLALAAISARRPGRAGSQHKRTAEHAHGGSETR